MTDTPGGTPRPSFVIVANGDPDGCARLPTDLDEATVVIAADGGLDIALEGGLAVHHVVGDMDSASPRALDRARADGVILHRFPADKDATDFELALELALDLASGREPGDHLLVVGPGGGRQDMVLADLLALAGPRLLDLEVTARYGEAEWLVVRPGQRRRFEGIPQEQVSLLPVHGRVHGVTTSGLRWSLADTELDAGSTRSISNTVVGGDVAISITAGVLLVCRTGRIATPVTPRPAPDHPQPEPEPRSEH